MLNFLPRDTKINFLGGRKIAMTVSALMVIGSIALFFTRGLNYGIDFKGGIEIHMQQEEVIDLESIRAIVGGLNLGDYSVRQYGVETEAMIRVEAQDGGADAVDAAIELIQGQVKEAVPDVVYLQSNFISPAVSEQLKSDGLLSVSLAVFAVLLYIWIRFEWQFGLGAVIALVHDVVLTIGFFSVTQLVFNLPIIAALLTIVGYSLNDTVVVYDRVRENIRRYMKKEVIDVLNLSLNQTLSRTVMTSVTTLLALLSLFIFGGEVIQGFTAAMIWGVVIGTYSSVFIASPVLLALNLEPDTMLAADKAEDSAARFRD